MTETVALPDDTEIIGALRDALTRLLPAEDLAQVDLEAVDVDSPLLALPVDSVVLMALMNELEDRFSVFIPEEEAFAFTVVGDIGVLIRQRLSDKAKPREQA
ncbi:acyl carrier protein [Mycobacteroides chelonae]|uniref:acyl carrier protein n=1 Tax=Mycobacteroides chelonae TaxID=1774 RepID=UPI0018B04035|nr:acyl carrier protein [Mycobacteroides chelonae]MBF9523822.1 acyl carrier protein [Mycobacteroides chelonae]